jgi:hypothetical protein
MAEFSDFLRSAPADQLLGGQFSQKLDELIGELRNSPARKLSEKSDESQKALLAQSLRR